MLLYLQVLFSVSSVKGAESPGMENKYTFLTFGRSPAFFLGKVHLERPYGSCKFVGRRVHISDMGRGSAIFCPKAVGSAES